MPDADPSRIAADQAAQLPRKRAEDKAWAGVTVPREAVEAALSAAWPVPRGWDFMAEVLAAAAPLIVAANQPEPSDDLRATLVEALERMLLTPGEVAAFEARLAPTLAAFVAAQVTAARADERARLALLEELCGLADGMTNGDGVVPTSALRRALDMDSA